MTTTNSLFARLPCKSKCRETAFYSEFNNQAPKPGRLGWIFGPEARQMAHPFCSFLFTFLISALPQFDIAREEDIVFYLKQAQNTQGKVLVLLGDWERKILTVTHIFVITSKKQESPVKKPITAQTFLLLLFSTYHHSFLFPVFVKCLSLYWKPVRAETLLTYLAVLSHITVCLIIIMPLQRYFILIDSELSHQDLQLLIHFATGYKS